MGICVRNTWVLKQSFCLEKVKFWLAAEALPLVRKSLWKCEAGNIWTALNTPTRKKTVEIKLRKL